MTLSHLLARSLPYFLAFFVLVLGWSCASVPGLRDEAGGSFLRVPFVRVLIKENTPSLTLKPSGSIAVECITAGEQAVYFASREIVVKIEGEGLTVMYGNGKLIQESVDEVNVIPREHNGRTRLETKRYRGIMKLLPKGANVQAVNILYMEDYLRGVVPSEIGDRIDEEIEAVKAQVIAARTYAMSHLKQYPGEPYDLKATVLDQVYDGSGLENALVNKAINATTGRVAMYQDVYINAYYHSTCGGMTDDIDKVWDRKESPYLKGVSDEGACSWSKYYQWTEKYSEEQLRNRIEQYLSADRGRDLRIGPITDVQVIDRTPGGRVNTLLVRTESDVHRFKRDQIRWVLKRSSNPDLILPSSRFELEIERTGDGNLALLTVIGRGYGHGVGMCQCGAIGYARGGWSVEKILGHYYRGAELKVLY